jgi:hypothetical protein
MAWMKRPTGLIKSWREHERFRIEYHGSGRECFVGANINNRSKLINDDSIFQYHPILFHSSAF